MNFITRKIGLVLGVLSFIGLFQWVYITWLNPTFGYLGFDYQAPLLRDQVLAWALSLLPIFWLPVDLRRPSQLICWVLYLAVFIPSMFVPLFTEMQPVENIRALMLVMFAGFALICLPNYIPVMRLPILALSRRTFWLSYWLVVAGLILWVAAVYRGHFQFVGFHEVYESIRFSSREVAKGTGVGYAAMLLSGSLMPFLMSWSLLNKRPLGFVFGALVLLMLYCTAGLKSILVSVVLTPALYFLLCGNKISLASKLIWTTVLLFLGLNLANQAVGELSRPHLLLSAMVFGRTFGGPGLITAMYHDFFNDHPLTYYSHVSGVNLIVPYPYEHGIGFEVGYYYTRNLDQNSNAHFWCADGLAALGLPGILLVSVLCALVFWFLDSLASGHKPLFSATAVSFAALNLSNMSLFTTLLSGGLFLSMLMLYVMPRESDQTQALPIGQPEGDLVNISTSDDKEKVMAGLPAIAALRYQTKQPT